MVLYSEAIEKLESIYNQQTEVDHQIDSHLSSLCELAKIDKQTKEQVQQEVQNALTLLEDEKVRNSRIRSLACHLQGGSNIVLLIS